MLILPWDNTNNAILLLSVFFKSFKSWSSWVFSFMLKHCTNVIRVENQHRVLAPHFQFYYISILLM